MDRGGELNGVPVRVVEVTGRAGDLVLDAPRSPALPASQCEHSAPPDAEPVRLSVSTLAITQRNLTAEAAAARQYVPWTTTPPLTSPSNGCNVRTPTSRPGVPGTSFPRSQRPTLTSRSRSAAREAIEIDGPAEFAAFGSRSNERFSFYVYIPLNFVVTIGNDGTATGYSYSHEVAEERDSGVWAEFYGTYEDEYSCFEATWRFACRHYRTYGRLTASRFEHFPLDVT